MGNCLQRRNEHKSQSKSFIGFTIVSNQTESKFSKLYIRCKKRLSRKDSLDSLGESNRSKDFFEYEDPLSKFDLKLNLYKKFLLDIIDDSEVTKFLKVEIEDTETILRQN